MSVWTLAAAVRRRWWVLLLGGLGTMGLLWQVRTVSPVYSSEIRVVFVSDLAYADLRRPQPGLITVAALVNQHVSERTRARTASDSVSLVGEGIREGFSVSLPNSGGQWVQIYERPELRVQAVGSSPGDVATQLDMAMREIREALLAVQAPFDIADRDLVQVRTAATSPVVFEGRGSRTRSAAAALLLGGLLTCAAVIGCDGLRTAQPRSRPV